MLSREVRRWRWLPFSSFDKRLCFCFVEQSACFGDLGASNELLVLFACLSKLKNDQDKLSDCRGFYFCNFLLAAYIPRKQGLLGAAGCATGRRASAVDHAA